MSNPAKPVMVKYSDDELMDLIKSKNSQALKEIYERYHIQVYNFLIRYTGNREIAQDILQETFTNVWFACNTFNARRGSFKNWIYKIGLNNAKNEMSKKRYSYNYIDTEDLDGSNDELASPESSRPDKVLECKDVKNKTLIALNYMKPYLREVVILKHYQQFKFREISEITNTSVGTLKARFHRAVSELNEYLGKMEL